MATTIKLKNGSGAPLAADLVQGEPAFDLTNKRLYTENASGTVIEIGTSPSTIDINAGTIDGTVIGGASAAAGTFTTATATTGNITTVNATTVDSTNLEVTNIKAKDGTSAGSIADSTGVVTLASSVLTTADINGGTIDGVTIGGASAGAGTFTTLTGSGDMNIDSGTLFVDVSADAVGIGTASPEEELHVEGNIVAGATVGYGSAMFGGTGLVSYNQSTAVEDIDALYLRKSGADGSSVGIAFGNAGGGSYYVGARIKHERSGSNSNGDLVFETKGDSSTNTTAEAMRIDSSGNVGIGTSSPTNALSVSGNANMRGGR